MSAEQMFGDNILYDWLKLFLPAGLHFGLKAGGDDETGANYVFLYLSFFKQWKTSQMIKYITGELNVFSEPFIQHIFCFIIIFFAQ